MSGRITLSIIKADVGSLAGHYVTHPKLLDVAKKLLDKAKSSGLLVDYFVCNCGDDLELIMTHKQGEDSSEIHKMAWNAFQEASTTAKDLGLYAAGQDLLADAFSGNLRGLGPGYAEMEIEERPSEPIVTFLMDKTGPGAFNLPLFRIFADPFCTSGLVFSPRMNSGFKFEVLDVLENKVVTLDTPQEMYDLLALIGSTERYVLKRVYTKDDVVCTAISTTKLNKIAGKYVGKDDPVAIVRAQHEFPAVGEILEPFAFPHLVAGWMRGSHNSPIMPVGLKDAKCTRFDGPTRVVALGFQINKGRLIGPADLFDDVAFDRSRRLSNEMADYMRRHGPFMPGRLPMGEMEYTTLKDVLERLKGRFKQA
jgi:fructose 1,6-bisphosphate aldolase/phosphatase